MLKKYDISPMKYIKTPLVLCALSFFFSNANAQEQGKAQFIYNIGFDQRFDNREYDVSDYSASGTIFGTRLSPTIGLKLRSGDAVHTLIGGADIRKDFGDINTTGKGLVKDYFYYYDFKTPLANGVFTIDGGVFPRCKSRESWSTAFISEKVSWYDPYIEGILFRYSTSRSNVELGLDWMGMYGADSAVNEQFMIFSAGHRSFSEFITLGYNAYMVHFANSVMVRGVCDNCQTEPYMTMDFTHFLSRLDECSLKLGYLQAIQRDRTVSLDFDCPALVEASVKVALKGWHIQNSFYAGDDILPLYDKTDAAGNIYGDRLYFADPFFKIQTGGDDGLLPFYDRLELGYSTVLWGNLTVAASWIFHFNTSAYSGSQQVISLRYLLKER